jgi:hypothetical protein
MRCDCHNRFYLQRTGIIIGLSSLGDVAVYGLSLTSSPIEVSVVAAVGLLAKVGVLKRMFVSDVDSSPRFKFMEMVRVGWVPEECSEVKGRDVWSSVWFNLHARLCSFSHCFVPLQRRVVAAYCCLLVLVDNSSDGLWWVDFTFVKAQTGLAF